MKIATLFLLGLLLQSCAGMFKHRSFVDKMDDEGPVFFSPERDFPVVSGDSGRSRPRMQDIMTRTPSSAKEELPLRQNAALEQELQFLEESQTTEKYYHYLEYKDKLANKSEKIYFLRLKSMRERNEYLYGKGLYQIASAPSLEVEEAVGNREVVVGMNKDSVTRSWGRPSRVDVAGNPTHENERWTFHYRGKLKQVYFENGKVQGWDIQD